MISALSGKLIEKQAPFLVIETAAGVSYDVQTSMTTFYHLPQIGEQVRLHTHLTIREDAHLLFGFHTLEERKLFRTLIKVNGVGPKVALTILSSIHPDAFVRCVMDQDVTRLVKLPGIGKKTAERLLIEMKDRCAEWEMPLTTELLPFSSSAKNDAMSALIALGYKPQEVNRALAQIEQTDLTTEALIRAALKGKILC